MQKKIVFCNCKGNIFTDEIKKEIPEFLSINNIPYYSISDLCAISAQQKNVIQKIFTEDSEILILACYPRVITNLCVFAHVSAKSVKTLSMREQNMEFIKEEIRSFFLEITEAEETKNIEAKSDWISWFPVIDYERCTNCGQCADFCLFGVYEKTETDVKVSKPELCKTNCPACARICPHTAIIFPKYEAGGAISGADNFNQIEEQIRQAQDIQTFLGDDIYSALEKRKLKRKSIIIESEMKKALEEREKALNKNTK